MVMSRARSKRQPTGINHFIYLASSWERGWNFWHELAPAATRVAVMVNSANAVVAESTLRDLEPTAHTLGLQIQVLNASNSREMDAAFESLRRERSDALYVANDALFANRRVQLPPLWITLCKPRYEHLLTAV